MITSHISEDMTKDYEVTPVKSPELRYLGKLRCPLHHFDKPQSYSASVVLLPFQLGLNQAAHDYYPIEGTAKFQQRIFTDVQILNLFF